MAKGFPPAMERLVDEFCKMPGIGLRSAQRMAFYVLKTEKEKVDLLAEALKDVKKNIRFCGECNNLSERDLCSVCSDTSRDRSKICVVEGPGGVMAIEKMGVYNGLYHVLLGALSPVDGIGPSDIRVEELVVRTRDSRVKEVIMATDFTTEGETTALFISGILRNSGKKVTRLSRGVPEGACLEFADVGTLKGAFEDRRQCSFRGKSGS